MRGDVNLCTERVARMDQVGDCAGVGAEVEVASRVVHPLGSAVRVVVRGEEEVRVVCGVYQAAVQRSDLRYAVGLLDCHLELPVLVGLVSCGEA